MILQKLIDYLTAAPKGANIVLEWNRPAKTRKDVPDTIRKAVRAVGRIGIDYNNLKSVQEKRGGELPNDPQSLPWGKWAIFPFLIEHNGNYYLRMYHNSSQLAKSRVTWTRNGVEVPFEEIQDSLLSSEKTEKTGECFMVKVSDLTTVGAA